jgi:hypothetical protein
MESSAACGRPTDDAHPRSSHLEKLTLLFSPGLLASF